MSRSEGEEAYAQLFQFKDVVPKKDHDELRDYLYKAAHNYNEAQTYFKLLKDVDKIDKDDRASELIFRIHGMALQSFALSMRRLSDRMGQRSIQKFIPKFIKPEYIEDELKKIQAVYSHYADYLDKGVAHQDTWGGRRGIEALP